MFFFSKKIYGLFPVRIFVVFCEYSFQSFDYSVSKMHISALRNFLVSYDKSEAFLFSLTT